MEDYYLDRYKDSLLNTMKQQFDNFFYNMKHISQHSRLQGTLTEGPSFLLHILWLNGPSKISDIAQKLGITNGAVTQMADKLVEVELISRERSKEDRRVVWLALTAKGKEIVAEIQDNRFEFVRSQLSQLPEVDLEKAIEVFEKFNSILSVIKDKEKRNDHSRKI